MISCEHDMNEQKARGGRLGNSITEYSSLIASHPPAKGR